MKPKIVCLFLLTLCLTAILHGQKRNNVLVFGDSAGLNFNTTPPTPISRTGVTTSTLTDASIVILNHTSSICDKNGNLLLYTNGREIWNRKHEKLKLQGTQWPWGGYAVPLLCPYPDNDSLYYLFAVSDNLHMLRYLTINMNGNEGLGAIVYPPPPIPFNYATTLLNDASVMLSGIGHCNKRDTWIIAHSGNSLHSFLVSETGVSTSPVVTPVAPSVITPGTYAAGNFKFAANSEKMIFPVLQQNKVVVFDFNNFNGQFSNSVTLYAPEGTELEEVEISPDGSKLYIGAKLTRPNNNPFNFESHLVYQMDLDAGSVAAIQNSMIELTPYADQSGCTPRTCFSVVRSLQLAPDGQIYVSYRSNETDAQIIKEPNLAGVNADYRLFAINLKKTYTAFNFNYIRSESFEPKRNGINVKKRNCANEPATFSLIYKNADSVKWDFGDPGSGAANFSTKITDAHLYPGPGSYPVTAIIYHPCFTDTARTTVVIGKDVTVKLPTWIKDTALCIGFDGTLDATTPNATSYNWSDGITNGPVMRIKQSGIYSVKASNECSMDIRRFTVRFDSCDCSVFVPNAFTPNNDGRNDVFKPLTTCFVQDYRFTIYNRYGGIVFSTTDRLKGWNGYKGVMQPGTQSYIWTLRYKDPNTRKIISRNGTVLAIL